MQADRIHQRTLGRPVHQQNSANQITSKRSTDRLPWVVLVSEASERGLSKPCSPSSRYLTREGVIEQFSHLPLR